MSLPSGGLGVSIQNLAQELVKKGLLITVFVYGQKDDLIFREGGINFHFIAARKYPFLGWIRYRKKLEHYLNHIIAREKINALEAPEWTGITALMSFKCRLILRLHGSDTYFCRLENRPQKKKNFWFERLALNSADHLISVSEFTAIQTKEIFKLNKDIEVIPNSVNEDVFYPETEGSGEKIILYFGTIIRKKGVLDLAEIFNKIHQKNPDVLLVMAGRDVIDVLSGSSTIGLFENLLTESARNRVLWKGDLSRFDVISELDKAAVVVFPSYAEALPMSWLEAMAMKKALVTSNIGWSKEIMKNGKTGYMVHPKDHNQFADRILELLQDRQLSLKMGEAARKHVKDNFSACKIVERNIDFYRSLSL